jgi:hypothetical protein
MSCKGQQRHRESLQHLRFSARPPNLEAVLGSSLQYKPHGNGMGLHIPNSEDSVHENKKNRPHENVGFVVLSGSRQSVLVFFGKTRRMKPYNGFLKNFSLGQFWVPV